MAISKGKTVVIVGDITHSRVARSNIALLKLFGAQIRVVGPPALIPEKIAEEMGVEVSYNLDEAIVGCDFIMTWRLQLERQKKQS